MFNLAGRVVGSIIGMVMEKDARNIQNTQVQGVVQEAGEIQLLFRRNTASPAECVGGISQCEKATCSTCSLCPSSTAANFFMK